MFFGDIFFGWCEIEVLCVVLELVFINCCYFGVIEFLVWVGE